MASINWKKMTAKDLDGCIVHFDKEMRLRHKHSNEHIDSYKTHLNYDMENPFRESIYELKDKVKKIDKEIPPLKKFGYDRRVIAVALETPCPEEISKLSENAEDDFFKTIYKCEKAFFKERVIYGAVHKDEQHTYINPYTKKVEMSRNHLHTFIIPYNKEYGINARKFVDKDLMSHFNKYCDTAIFRQFGVHLNNGKGRNNWGSVESLKEESKQFESKLDKSDLNVLQIVRTKNAWEVERKTMFDTTYKTLDTFRQLNPNGYKTFVKKECKENSIIYDIAIMLSEKTYGIGNYGKDPIWAELDREEEERKKKRKKEEIQRCMEKEL